METAASVAPRPHLQRRGLRSAPAASTARPQHVPLPLTNTPPALLLSHTLRPSVVFSQSKLFVMVGGCAAFYTAVLSAMPEHDVTISPSNLATSLRVTPTLHVFTKQNWATPHSFRVAAVGGALFDDGHYGSPDALRVFLQTIEHCSRSRDIRFHADRVVMNPSAIAVHVTPRDGAYVFATGRLLGTATHVGKGTATATRHAFDQVEMETSHHTPRARGSSIQSTLALGTARSSLLVASEQTLGTAAAIAAVAAANSAVARRLATPHRRSVATDASDGDVATTFLAPSAGDAANILRVACRKHQTLLLQRNGSVVILGKREGMNETPSSDDNGSDDGSDAALSKMLIDVACGDDHVAAITEHGYVLAWGDGRDGRLGLGSTTSRSAPTLVRSLLHKRIVQLACGARHTLALAEDGDVFAWGYGASGALGLATSAQSKAPIESVATPMEVVTLKHQGVAILACGDLHSAVVLTSGALLTCGWAEHGRLGRPTARGDESSNCFVPVDLHGERCTFVACGGAHTLALTAEYHVVAFGENASGQLGVGDGRFRIAPTRVTYFDDEALVVTSVAAGHAHSFATTADGRVFAWGSDEFGQCGVGAFPQLYTAPHLVPSAIGLGVTQIACGDGHSVVLGYATQRHLDVLEANHPTRYAQLVERFERFVEDDKIRRRDVLRAATRRRDAHNAATRQRKPPRDPSIPRSLQWQAQLQKAQIAAETLVTTALTMRPQTAGVLAQATHRPTTASGTKGSLGTKVRCSSAALWRRTRLFTFEAQETTAAAARPSSSKLRLTTEARHSLGRMFHGDGDGSRAPNQLDEESNQEGKAEELRVAAQFSVTRPKSAPSRACSNDDDGVVRPKCL